MPPEENANKNNPNFGALKIGIDPVFKSTTSQTNPATPLTPGGAFNVLNSQKYTPTQPAGVPVPQPQINSAPNQKSIVRTLKGDMETAIQTEHLSSINIAIAENQRMHEQINSGAVEQPSTGDYSKNKVIIFISFLLVIAGIVGISIVYFTKKSGPAPAPSIQELPSLITTEFKDMLDTDTVVKNKLTTVLGKKLNDSQFTVNNLYNSYLTTGSSTGKRLITAKEFVTLAGFKMPDIAKRTLLPDFMVGTYSFRKNLPYVIFKTSSFENTYAGMLNWEKDMADDFKILFRLPGYDQNIGISAELTPSVFKKFEDKVIVNKDVRLLRDELGNIILLYGIIDKETVIITVSDVAFKEILNRLNKEQALNR